MSKLFLALFMMIATSNTWAAEFDWEKLATSHTVNGQTLKISRMTFKERYFAFQFCQKIGMVLADIKTITEASKDAKAPQAAIKFKADLGDTLLDGIWAWTSEPVKKVKDASVFIQLNGNPKVDIENFNEVNHFLLSKGVTPYKGLPAICR